MLCLKKVYRDELLQIAILLSLLRVDRNAHLYDGYDLPAIGVGIDDLDVIHESPRGLGEIRVHPKNLDSILINHEQRVFDELNSLGRYNRINALHQDVTAYLLNVDGEDGVPPGDQDTASNDTVTPPSPPPPPLEPVLLPPPEHHDPRPSCSPILSKHEIGEEDLTQEDMALIENLWSQDVDMESVAEPSPDTESGCSKDSPFFGAIKPCPTEEEDPLAMRVKQEVKDEEVSDEEGELMPWVGVDLGYPSAALHHDLVKDEPEGSNEGEEREGETIPLIEEPDFSLAEALDLVGLDEDTFNFADSRDRDEVLSSQFGAASRKCSESSGRGSSGEEEEDDCERRRRGEESGQDGGDEEEEEEEKKEKEEETDTGFASPSVSSDDDLDELSDLLFGMIQAPSQYHHPRSFQGRMPYVRTMSMEQRWQDLASLLSLPDPNHPYHHHYHPHPHGGHPHHPYPGSPGGYPHAEAARTSASASGGGGNSVLLSNATLPPPALTSADVLNASAAYPSLGSNGNFGSAVATSMNLTNSSEPTVSEATGSSFKMENHESLYYSHPMCASDSGNNTSEMNHTTDGFLSSILNDEDIQLMDMAMNEGMYTMRMLEGGGAGSGAGGSPVVGSCGVPGGERGGTDSDSAVSSMGSERVPSLSSDTEWMETNSDSGHTPGDHYSDYHSKYRWYDYSYQPNRHHSGASDVGSGSSRSMHPVAQKKHHMYGKRFFQEQGTSASSLLGHASGSFAGAAADCGSGAGAGALPPHYPMVAGDPSKQPSHPEMKYSCSLEFSRQAMGMMRTPMEHVAHNHTYHLPPEQTGVMQRPMSREKLRGKKAEDEHLTRDEKRARALNVPITVSDIINLPMDEFNERLSKYDLSESQLSLIRDIRRRGKNKVAAQNCRKRKLDQIMSLADEVKEMRDRKQRLLREHEFLIAERQRVRSKFSQLYRHIFQALRDADGNPYSPYEWSLQQAADGSVMVVPRGAEAGPLLEPPDSRRPPRHNNKEPDPDSTKQS
ncbi:segmentation protein cap'n'collar isoform X2 [Nilaparvata lugens]|uniref:segmentation protein cap'n'collar isoform X2 n=1 Tax=Nilaparvata lugens TaxID=108931 RepID=UPI00193DF60F|nr:segmentation protein cap'n'collar isoform X2 [Nilaparvata lugens]